MTVPDTRSDPSAPRRSFVARVLEVDGFAAMAREIEGTDSDPEGVGIMTRKARIFPVRLDRVPLKAAPLLKQEMLSVGADSAHARGVADLSVEETPVVLIATWGQYLRVIPKLRRQPFQLRPIANAVERALRSYASRSPKVVRGAHRSFTVGNGTLVIGVVNVTPDSFSDGGRFLTTEAAVAHALRLEEEGAGLIDIGGESTRPGADPVDSVTEWSRIGPVLQALNDRLSVPISIDTYHADVAAQAIAAGADVVNDVTGLRDPEMRTVVSRTGAAAIVMHLRGTPKTMQDDPTYRDVRAEVFDALARATERAIADGVAADKLLIDPGLGFGKSAEASLELLAHAGELRSLGYPVVIGASRKSFLGSFLGGAPVGQREEAGIAAAVLAAFHGVQVIRTHDVAPTVRALKLADAAIRLQQHPVGRSEIELLDEQDD